MLPVQRMATTYITKRLKDELLRPLEGGGQDDHDHHERSSGAPTTARDPHDGKPVHDENGNVIGRAWRVPEAVVYVVTRDGDHAAQELARGLREDETQMVFHTTSDDHVTAIFYVPPPRAGIQNVGRGFRPDDV